MRTLTGTPTDIDIPVVVVVVVVVFFVHSPLSVGGNVVELEGRTIGLLLA